jgi:hypothetical protein
MRHDPLSVFRQSYSYRTAPLLPLPAGRGEGRGEGPLLRLRLAERPPRPASPRQRGEVKGGGPISPECGVDEDEMQ